MGFSSPQESQLSNIAGQQQVEAGSLNKTGMGLMKPLQTGTLPPAAQALVNQMLQSNLANDRNAFAKLGLTGSTMEAGALDQARQSSLGQTFGIEEDMAKLGLQAMQESLSGLSGSAGTFQDIAANQTALDAAFMQAIGNFGKALGGGVNPGK